MDAFAASLREYNQLQKTDKTNPYCANMLLF